MEAARQGDRQALDLLLRRHYDRLYAVCRRLTGDDADAADACQEGLVAIVRGLPGFDFRSTFGTWAYRIVTNAALDELRRRRRRPAPEAPETLQDRPGVATAFDAASGAEQERVATRIDIDAALATLSPEFRAPVVLRDLCGLSYDEIAQVLDVPPGTVRSRIARARSALAPLLAPGGNRAGGRRRQSGQR